MTRRIDPVLVAIKARVLKANAEYEGRLENLEDFLRKASGYAFYLIDWLFERYRKSVVPREGGE